MLFTIVTRIYFNGFEKDKDGTKLVAGLSVLCLYFSIENVIALYCLICLALKFRYNLLNVILYKNQHCKILAKISNHHIQLSEIIHLINQSFGLPMGFFFFFNMVQNIFGSFEIFLAIKKSTDWEYAIISIIWNISTTSFMIAIVVCAEKTLKSETKIERILNELLKSNDKNLKRILIIMDQFKHTKPELSCWIFRFDWKFILNFLGEVLAFLVILIQFDVKFRNE
ncbi:hypothetical protein PVAND_014499 [Polypedilum vanderplanki]|uniref:Gustatory receptor n=1 Tax=Polypedilum vanderplanki TaxID=319348 RepID=A0A9J6BA62_POLVA|nr:hypothetical protein PVAND_014499 [Polypedilum vanderplanki]